MSILNPLIFHINYDSCVEDVLFSQAIKSDECGHNVRNPYQENYGLASCSSEQTQAANLIFLQLQVWPGEFWVKNGYE